MRTVKKGYEKSLRQAFDDFEKGDITKYKILLNDLVDLWWPEILNRISSRIAQKERSLNKTEKLRRVRELARLAVKEAGADVLLSTLKGNINNVDDLREQFGITFGYWLLRAEIKDIIH
jgi:hypothetical protein